MKRFLSILFTFVFTFTALFSYSAYGKNNKVAICHNLGNGEYIVIVVSERAAGSHMSQHDDLPLNASGECGEDPLPPPPPPPPPLP